MSRSRKPSENPKPVTPDAPAMRMQVRGPLNPSEPEVTVYLTSDGAGIGPTDAAALPKSKAVTLLVTDDASLLTAIAHRQARTDCDPSTIGGIISSLRALPVEDRTAAVAGSAALCAAALDHAFRVVAICAKDDPPPAPVSTWRSSRAKGSSVTVLTRD